MDTYFEASFEKDLKKLKDRTALQAVEEIIAEVKQAKTIRDIANLKKLKGYETYYRIRFGRYLVSGLKSQTIPSFLLVVYTEKIFIGIFRKNNA